MREKERKSRRIPWWPQRDSIELVEFMYAISLCSEADGRESRTMDVSRQLLRGRLSEHRRGDRKALLGIDRRGAHGRSLLVRAPTPSVLQFLGEVQVTETG